MENKQRDQTTTFNTRLPQIAAGSPSINKGDDCDGKSRPNSEEFSDNGTGTKT